MFEISDYRGFALGHVVLVEVKLDRRGSRLKLPKEYPHLARVKSGIVEEQADDVKAE